MIIPQYMIILQYTMHHSASQWILQTCHVGFHFHQSSSEKHLKDLVLNYILVSEGS